MTFDQISYFLAVEKHKNFTHAADEMLISQSSLSKQIKALENELGVILFSRDNYKIELTAAGKLFLPFAINFSRDYLKMMSSLSSFTNTSDSIFTVKLGIIPILCCRNLIGVLTDLESRNQNIHIDLTEREQSELGKMLNKGQIDFAIARADYLSEEDYDFVPLVTEKIGVLCSAKHHLASKRTIGLCELKDESFIFLNDTSSLYRLCIEACNSAGFSPKVNYYSSRHEALLAKANTGLDLTLLPKSLLDLENKKSLKYIPLRDDITSTLALIRKKDMKINKKIINFQNTIRDYFKMYFTNNETNIKKEVVK